METELVTGYSINWFYWLVAGLLLSTLSYGLIVLLIKRSQLSGQLDVPNERSMHKRPTPTGAGIVLAVFVFMAAFVLGIYFQKSQFYCIAVVVALLAAIGWYDDNNELSAKFRLVCFFIISGGAILFLGAIDQFHFGSTEPLQIHWFLASVFSLLFFVWLLNLYNFMDGMDGLAAMQTIIAVSGFLIFLFRAGLFVDVDNVDLQLGLGLMILSAVLLFSTIGFLLLNWSPAKIFLGDVGSLPIGGLFAILTVLAVSKFGVSFFSCVLLLAVFIFDATYTLIARLSRGENITEAHRSHLYQRLDDVGLSHNTIVSVYSMLMLFFMVTAFMFEWELINAYVTGVLALLGVIFMRVWVFVLEK